MALSLPDRAGTEFDEEADLEDFSAELSDRSAAAAAVRPWASRSSIKSTRLPAWSASTWMAMVAWPYSRRSLLVV